MFTTSQKYVRLGSNAISTDQANESEKASILFDTSVNSSELSFTSHGTSPKSMSKIIVALQVAFFCVSSLLFMISFILFSKVSGGIGKDNASGAHIYSPVFDRIDLGISTTKFNGSFLNTHPPSIYRQDPSPEVDDAWERIADTGAMPISSEEVRKVGKNPLNTAKYPPSFGLGPDAHIASIDVFHQIHCLNEMRKWIYPNYYFSGFNISDPLLATQKIHITHCTYLLLQNIMCHADAEVYTWRWVDVQRHPLPDFTINKQCRDFGALMKYRDEHYWDFDPVKMPPDVEPFKAPPEFLDLFQKWNYSENRVVPVADASRILAI